MLASSKLCSRTMVILFEHRVAEEAASFVEGARCLTERFRMVAAGVTESSSKIFAVWALCIKGCPSSCDFTLRYLGLCPVQGLSSRFAFSSVAHRPCMWQRKSNDVHADGGSLPQPPKMKLLKAAAAGLRCFACLPDIWQTCSELLRSRNWHRRVHLLLQMKPLK